MLLDTLLLPLPCVRVYRSNIRHMTKPRQQIMGSKTVYTLWVSSGFLRFSGKFSRDQTAEQSEVQKRIQSRNWLVIRYRPDTKLNIRQNPEIKSDIRSITGFVAKYSAEPEYLGIRPDDNWYKKGCSSPLTIKTFDKFTHEVTNRKAVLSKLIL